MKLLPLALPAGNPGPLTGRGNTTYLLTGAVPTLIDAGVGREPHLDALAALLGPGVPLAQVVVTHAHTDHASGAPSVSSRYASAVFLKFPWPERDRGIDVAWRALADGERIRAGDDEIEVVHTPGHAPDHICLWHAPTRTLFGGDLLVAGTTVLVPGGRGGHLASYLASLERVRRLAPSLVLPAHGPVIRDPIALIDRYLAHRADRERQVLDAIAGGAATVASIVDRVYPDVIPGLREAASMTVEAHLEKLEHEERISRSAGILSTCR